MTRFKLHASGEGAAYEIEEMNEDQRIGEIITGLYQELRDVFCGQPTSNRRRVGYQK